MVITVPAVSIGAICSIDFAVQSNSHVRQDSKLTRKQMTGAMISYRGIVSGGGTNCDTANRNGKKINIWNGELDGLST